jgi:hypothetical protein
LGVDDTEEVSNVIQLENNNNVNLLWELKPLSE